MWYCGFVFQGLFQLAPKIKGHCSNCTFLKAAHCSCSVQLDHDWGGRKDLILKNSGSREAPYLVFCRFSTAIKFTIAGFYSLFCSSFVSHSSIYCLSCFWIPDSSRTRKFIIFICTLFFYQGRMIKGISFLWKYFSRNITNHYKKACCSHNMHALSDW